MDNKLKDKFLRYFGHTSAAFERILTTLSRSNEPRWNLLNSDAAVDWDLIKVQPMRYLWNETEQILYFSSLAAGSATSSCCTSISSSPPPLLKVRQNGKDGKSSRIAWNKLIIAPRTATINVPKMNPPSPIQVQKGKPIPAHKSIRS